MALYESVLVVLHPESLLEDGLDRIEGVHSLNAAGTGQYSRLVLLRPMYQLLDN